jgi:hypothetical protein
VKKIVGDAGKLQRLVGPLSNISLHDTLSWMLAINKAEIRSPIIEHELVEVIE